jgi:hypothetical protein
MSNSWIEIKNGVNHTGMVNAVQNAKQAALQLRENMAKLSTLERTVGAKYLAPVLSLIEAVEEI